ncbi:hypothetical protein V5799_030553 [Amblyomma americanum]|uniref:Uncharacterized protein n=1 Tax=Amblyomma americanum TaxID=6943 RepID=A0AAQ4EMR8_AMBAM
MPAEAKGGGGKSTVPVVSEVCPTTSPADQARDAVVNPEVPPASTELPEAPKDVAAPTDSKMGEKSTRKHHKRRRSSVKPRRSSEDVAKERSGTGRVKRHKHKSAEGEAGRHGNEEPMPCQVPPAPTTEAGNEPTKKQETSAFQVSESKPTEVTASEGKDPRRLEGQEADNSHLAGPQPSMSSAPAEGNHSAQDAKGGDGGAKETNGNRQDEDVDVEAHANGTDKEGEDANSQEKAEEDSEDRLKDEDSETRKQRKRAKVLKRASCVSFQSPDDEPRGTRGTGTAAIETPSRQAGKCPFMTVIHVPGDVFDLQATTLRVDSVERARPGSQHVTALVHLQYRSLGIVVAVVSAVVALSLVLWISIAPKPFARGVCRSVACAELSASFEGVLNYQFDPCVNLNAFVCSKGHMLGSGFDVASRSSMAHHIKEYQLAMVDLLLSAESTTFTASSSAITVLRSQNAAQASTWFELVQTLEGVGSREKYFQMFHKRYNAPLTAPEKVALWLETEKDVLSILDAVRSPGTIERPVIAHLAKIAANISNCTVDNWISPVTNTPGGSAVDEKTLVSVQDVRLLRAVDQILSKYSADALMQHLSWWLLQILIVIGSPQDYVIIAGSQEVALWPLKVDSSNGTLWQLYEKLCVSCQPLDNLTSVQGSESETNATSRRAMLMDSWLHINFMFWSLTDRQRELMQHQWQGDTLDAFRYETLTNRLRVSHAALRHPFYHPDSDEVFPANLGGLGASFLTHALQMFVAPVRDAKAIRIADELGNALKKWATPTGFNAVASFTSAVKRRTTAKYPHRSHDNHRR